MKGIQAIIPCHTPIKNPAGCYSVNMGFPAAQPDNVKAPTMRMAMV